MWDLIVSVPDHCLSFYFSLLLEELIFDFYKKINRRFSGANPMSGELYIQK